MPETLLATEAGLRASEEIRRTAMLNTDLQRLEALLEDSLCYVHSTGVTDSKASYLHKLSRGALRYESLVFASPRFTLIGNTGLVHAEMQATVLHTGNEHAVASSNLAVWQYGASRWTLHAFQATPCIAA